jgi:hypothetical protein
VVRSSRDDDPASLTIEPADESGLAWVDQHVSAAKATVAASGLDEARELSPETLDRLYAELASELRASDASHDAINQVVTTVGLAFGQVLADRLALEWVVVSDGESAEIALQGQPGDFLVFPTHLVAARWESGDTDFLVATFEDARAHLAELRAES